MQPIPVPMRRETLESCGLDHHFLIDLIAKILSNGGTMTPSAIAAEIKLYRPAVHEIIQIMIKQLLVEAQGLEGTDLRSEIRYCLTDAGLKRALEAISKSAYSGAAPVPLGDFTQQIILQSISRERITQDQLRKALSHLVLNDQLLMQVGPAANSARSILFYGDPGNGKTSIAKALSKCFDDIIYIPRAILIGGQIVKFFDETVHEPADISPEVSAQLDHRWVPCRRPVVLTGGELRLADLDLRFDPLSRYYEAPMHTKALGGIFILDDFGRQRDRPQDFLNRWIIPLETREDFFSLHTGKKFSLPYDQLVIFSTNRLPEEIGDGASLRRIYYKVFVPNPTKEEYLRIFDDACRAASIDFDKDVILEFFDSVYGAQDLVTSGSHPEFLLAHIKAASTFLGQEPRLQLGLLNLAWKNVSASKRSLK